MTAPELLVIYESTEGLAPQIVERVAACIELVPADKHRRLRDLHTLQ